MHTSRWAHTHIPPFCTYDIQVKLNRRRGGSGFDIYKRIRSVLLRSRRYDRAAMINIGCVCFPPVCLHLSRGRNERLVPQIQSQGASPDWTIPAVKSISSSLGTISALQLLLTFSAEEIRHFSTFFKTESKSKQSRCETIVCLIANSSIKPYKIRSPY